MTTRENGEQRGVSGGENADFAGVALARPSPGAAPTLGERAKKIPTDEGWDFRYWWSWREPKDYTPPESTIYFFVKNQWLNGIENFTRDTLALGCHPKMWSQVYLFLAFLGRLTFADAGSIPHFSMLPANSAFCTAPTPSNAAQKTR